MKIVTVGLEDLRCEDGADIGFLFARTLRKRLLLVPEGGGSLTDTSLVLTVVHVEDRLHHDVHAGLLGIGGRLSHHAGRVGIDQLGLQVDLLTDKIGVPHGVGQGRLLKLKQLIDLLHELSAHGPG